MSQIDIQPIIKNLEQDLELKIKELVAENSRLREMNSKLFVPRDALLDIKDKLERLTADIELEKNRSGKENILLQLKNRSLSEERIKLCGKIVQLEAELSDVINRNNLTVVFDTLNQKLRDDIYKEQNELDFYNNRLNTANEELAESLCLNEELRDQLVQLKYELFKQSTKLDKAKVEERELNEELEAKVPQLQDELSTERKQRIEMLEKLDSYKLQLDSANEDKIKLAESFKIKEEFGAKLQDDYKALLELVEEMESKLIETTKRNEELEGIVAELRDEISTERIEMQGQLVSYKIQLDLAEANEFKLLTESKLAETATLNRKLEANFLQLQDDLAIEKAEVQGLFNYHRVQQESANETKSKLAVTVKLNEELEAKLLQLQVDLSKEKAKMANATIDRLTESSIWKSNKELRAKVLQQQIDFGIDITHLPSLLNYLEAQQECSRVTRNKLAETTKLKEALEERLLLLQRELSGERKVRETESKLKETTKLNRWLEGKLSRLEDELSIERAEFQGQLEALLKMADEAECKLAKTTKLIGQLKVTQLLQLQEEVDLSKSQLDEGKETESNQVETEEFQVNLPPIQKIDSTSKDELSMKTAKRDFCHEETLSGTGEASSNVDHLSKKNSYKLEEQEVTNITNHINQDTELVLKFNREENADDNVNLSRKLVERYDLLVKVVLNQLVHNRNFISLLKENLRNYPNQLASRNYIKASKYLEDGTSLQLVNVVKNTKHYQELTEKTIEKDNGGTELKSEAGDAKMTFVQSLKKKLEELEKSAEPKSAENLHLERVINKLKTDHLNVLNVLHLGSQSSDQEKILAEKTIQILCLEDDKKTLTQDIVALQKMCQKIAYTKDAEKNDLKKERKLLRDERTEMHNTIAKMKFENGKLKERYINEKTSLEDNLNLVVKEKNKVLTDYLEIKLKYSELSDVTASKNDEIEALKQKMQSKCDEYFRCQMQSDRIRFQQEQIRFEDQIRHLTLEKEELRQSCITLNKTLQSRDFDLQKVFADSKNAQLRMIKFVADTKAAEESRQLQIQRFLADHSKISGESPNLGVDATNKLKLDFDRAILVLHEVERIIFKLLDEDLSCGICDDVMVKSNILNCIHVFCEACVSDFSGYKRVCPICDTPIVLQKHSALLDNLVKDLSASYKKLNEFTIESSTQKTP